MSNLSVQMPEIDAKWLIQKNFQVRQIVSSRTDTRGPDRFIQFDAARWVWAVDLKHITFG